MASNEVVQILETTMSVLESIPETMKTAVLRDHEVGLQIEILCTPRPKTGEILIKVATCGLCHSDPHVIGGTIAFPLPAVSGYRVSGTIAELGPDNEHTGLTVGQKVAGGFLMPCGQYDARASGCDKLCGPFFDLNRLKGIPYDSITCLATSDDEPTAMYFMGGLAEYAVVPSTVMAPVPDIIDMAPVAILGCTAMTGYGVVRRGADLCYGETVVVVAIRGVGTNIAQIARTFGVSQVIAINANSEKPAPMLDYGAMAVADSVTQNVCEEVFRLTGDKGVDVSSEALDIPATWTTVLDVLADGGRVVPIGPGAGVQTVGVEINRTVCHSQSILGSHGARARQDLPVVVDLVDKGVVNHRDVVSRRLPLEEAGAGYTALRNREIQGHAIVDMSL